ncbi:hypothetical protein OG889_32785 [Streptomyces sp. NBC_00481]|uniref:hypothetical protein n=1 Tax=Streptomyces sp. NBC_00481 TaxID=2975755 RepID=UPI002DDC1385|nr:hypothetical protein [Streptomyces sp. NBC_00481]WRY99050.1 hypothetical protein OG889_32785 [Streptomyces sp. NBC_00481]
MTIIWSAPRPGQDARRDREQMVPALLRERETYVIQGKTDRVRQVDEQLDVYGYDPEVGFAPAAPPTAADEERERLEQDAERQRQGKVRALLEEREQLLARQERAAREPRDRVALVDEQLAHYRHDGGAET